jgi:tyrosyl-tRNA synthetase
MELELRTIESVKKITKTPYNFYKFWTRELHDFPNYYHKNRYSSDIQDIINKFAKEYNKDAIEISRQFTKLVYGEDGLDYVDKASRLYSDKNISDIPIDIILNFFESVPCHRVYEKEYLGKPLSRLIADIGFKDSEGEARRAIKRGDIIINNIPIITDDMNILLDRSHIIQNKIMLLRHGVRQYFVVIFE